MRLCDRKRHTLATDGNDYDHYDGSDKTLTI